jgi:ribosomal protein S7
MKKYVYINSDLFNELYYLYTSTLVGKLIKNGNKTKAITLYNILKENIKLQTNKKKEVSFILLVSMLNSIPKVSFKEIRLGSQKKDVPMPINKKKQVLVTVDTLLKFSKKKKKVEFYNLMNHIISSYQNKGIIIRNKKLKYRKAIMNKMLLNIFMPRKQNRREKTLYVSEKNNYQIFKNKTTL